MYTTEKLNGKPVEIQNILVTDLTKLMTYVKVETKSPINGCYIVWANPKTYNYGLDGDTYSCMDSHFYDYNKMILQGGFTVEQLKELDSHINTRLNNRFRDGQTNGARWERKCSTDKNLVSYI